MGHGTSIPVYVQADLWAEDLERAALLANHAHITALKHPSSEIQISLVTSLDGTHKRARVSLRKHGIAVHSYFVEWPSGWVCCMHCSGRGNSLHDGKPCEYCQGTGHMNENIAD